jgi:cold shock CspA family protein
MRTAAIATGSVDTFDTSRGLGTIVGDDGREYLFHCVEITDGTREIAPGTAVRFGILAKLGRREAHSVSAR